MTKTLFNKYAKIASVLLELIHAGTCDKMSTHAISNSLNFVTFIKDYNWYNYVYLMKTKFKILKRFKYLVKEVKNQLDKKN